MSGARSSWPVAAAILATVIAVGAGVVVGGGAPSKGRGPVAAALAVAPASSTVLGVTDWQHIDYGTDAARVRDLTSRSAVQDSLPGLRATFGWRIRDLRWEAYVQGTFGDAAVVSLRRDLPTRDELRKLGYERAGRVWISTGRIRAAQPLYAVVGVFRRQGLVVLSTGRRSADEVAETIAGGARPWAANRDAAAVAQALAGRQSVFLQLGALGCEATDPAIDADALRQLAAAQARHGRVTRYSMLGRGLRDDGSNVQRFTLAMTFGSPAVAARQARIRAALSSGAFIGRTGDMSEVLADPRPRSDGNLATIDYRHPVNSEYLMTGQGPLLPAACGRT